MADIGRDTRYTDLPAIIPEMDYTNQAKGCGDIFVYKSNHNQSEFILVSIDARNTQLSGSPVMLNFAEQSQLIGAQIEIYSDTGGILGEMPYCNDIGQSIYPQSVWQATSSVLTITANASVETEPCFGEPYLETILIEKVTFVLDDQTVYLPSLLFEEVTVGWCPG